MPHGTHWVSEAIDRFKAGDKNASNEIWQFAFPVVLRYARGVMRGQPRTATDEEDVALSSLASLFRGMNDRRFPRLERGEDLLRIVFTIAWRKAKDHRGRASNRHGDIAEGGPEASPLSTVAGDEPSAESVAEMGEAIQRIHALLCRKDPLLVRIAELLIGDCTIVEIAEQIGRSVSTVKRKIERIESTLREEWNDACESAPH